jgi:nitroimidazol reductase NimA-like FMN-containing flavoprotein (pyridoxamine 5'-phosphate oxidase superfamily)
MPGYGIEPSGELLPWSWALVRLLRLHDYWVASTWPDGRPHVMPVWGAWHEESLWFSSSRRSRKARNLAHNPSVSVTTDNALEPVVVDGIVEFVTDRHAIEAFAQACDAKYDVEYGVEFYASADNVCCRVRPTSIFALDSERFTDSPTRWTRR